MSGFELLVATKQLRPFELAHYTLLKLLESFRSLVSFQPAGNSVVVPHMAHLLAAHSVIVVLEQD